MTSANIYIYIYLYIYIYMHIMFTLRGRKTCGREILELNGIFRCHVRLPEGKTLGWGSPKFGWLVIHRIWTMKQTMDDKPHIWFLYSGEPWPCHRGFQLFGSLVLWSKEVWKLNFRQYGKMEMAQQGRNSDVEKVRSEKIRDGESQKRCRCAKR